MKWHVNHNICKLSVISYTSVLAAAILMSIPRINLSRRIRHEQCSTSSLKLCEDATIGRKHVMFCGADGSSVVYKLIFRLWVVAVSVVGVMNSDTWL